MLTGRYTLERELGRGGMGTVYLSQDLRHKRRVAIQGGRPEPAAGRGPGRFLREIWSPPRLYHPRTPQLLEPGGTAGARF